MLVLNSSSRKMDARDHFKNMASPKRLMRRGNFSFCTILAFVVSILVIASCEKDDGKNKGPDEIIKNPSVSSAIDKSDMPVYKGTTPPPLAGTYLSDGEVTDVSSLFNGMIGIPLQSEFILLNQTTSGKIDLEERIDGIKATGSGGYITGANGNFTIYIESKQTGSEAGLPKDVSVTVVMLMSGTKASNGNLINVEGLTVFTSAKSSNKSYDLSAIKGSWYKWEANFYLQKGAKSSVTLIENIGDKALIKTALTQFQLQSFRVKD